MIALLDLLSAYFERDHSSGVHTSNDSRLVTSFPILRFRLFGELIEGELLEPDVSSYNDGLASCFQSNGNLACSFNAHMSLSSYTIYLPYHYMLMANRLLNLICIF